MFTSLLQAFQQKTAQYTAWGVQLTSYWVGNKIYGIHSADW